MVSSGVAKLVIVVVVLTTFYGFFDYGIRGSLEAVTQPSEITEMQFARMNVTAPYSVFHNVSQTDARVEYQITDVDLYGVTWHTGGGGYFTFDYKHFFWEAIGLTIPPDPPYQRYPSISEPLVISNWDDDLEYTRIIIDPQGGKQQDAYFFIRANSTHYLYDNITDSLDAGDIGMMIGGQLPRLETDFFSIVGIVGTSFLTGITAPFTGEDYPVVLSLINYLIIVLAALALALFLRG